MTLTIVFFVGDTTRSAKLKPNENKNKITQKGSLTRNLHQPKQRHLGILICTIQTWNQTSI
jgi:hypothetical protein